MSAASQETVTFTEAIESAARLLRYAEAECDLVKMERFESLADSWVSIAAVIQNG